MNGRTKNYSKRTNEANVKLTLIKLVLISKLLLPNIFATMFTENKFISFKMLKKRLEWKEGQ